MNNRGYRRSKSADPTKLPATGATRSGRTYIARVSTQSVTSRRSIDAPETGAPANITSRTTSSINNLNTSISVNTDPPEEPEDMSELSNVSNHASDIDGHNLILRRPLARGGLNVGNNNGGIINTGRNTSSNDQDENQSTAKSHHNFAFTNYQINSKTDPTDQRMHALELNVSQLNAGIMDIKTILLGQGQSTHSQTDGTVESDIKREQVDIHPIEITFQGRELTTSPCLLMVGDEVYWKYSGNLIKQVKIVQVEKPKLLRRHPIYHVELSNGKTHDVRHDELFITKDEATQLSPTGKITARQSILTTASSQLDLACIGNQYLSLIHI